jgi:uncharacterized membrane protein YadS
MRGLWIIPAGIELSLFHRPKNSGTTAKIVIPWFILLFLSAGLARTYASVIIPVSIYEVILNLAQAGMSAALFLIGASLSRETLKKVGFRPIAQAALLWVAISAPSLWAIAHLV